jgi:hypothetical protein
MRLRCVFAEINAPTSASYLALRHASKAFPLVCRDRETVGSRSEINFDARAAVNSVVPLPLTCRHFDADPIEVQDPLGRICGAVAS